MISTPKIARFALDVWRAGRAAPDAIAARRQERLQALLRFARTHSAFYGNLYAPHPNPIRDLQELPDIRVKRSPRHPTADPASGKFRLV